MAMLFSIVIEEPLPVLLKIPPVAEAVPHAWLPVAWMVCRFESIAVVPIRFGLSRELLTIVQFTIWAEVVPLIARDWTTLLAAESTPAAMRIPPPFRPVPTAAFPVQVLVPPEMKVTWLSTMVELARLICADWPALLVRKRAPPPPYCGWELGGADPSVGNLV